MCKLIRGYYCRGPLWWWFVWAWDTFIGIGENDLFSSVFSLYNRVFYCCFLTESTQSWCYLKRKTIETFRQSLKIEVSVRERGCSFLVLCSTAVTDPGWYSSVLGFVGSSTKPKISKKTRCKIIVTFYYCLKANDGFITNKSRSRIGVISLNVSWCKTYIGPIIKKTKS